MSNATIEAALIRRELINARKSSGITQTKMSEITGLSQATISNFESDNDDRSPSLKTVMLYAEAIGKRIYISTDSVTSK